VHHQFFLASSIFSKFSQLLYFSSVLESMLSYSSSSDPIDQWLHSNKSSQKKYFINQIPLGLLCDSATDFLDPSENSNNVIGQVILPNSSWGCRLCQLSFPSIQEHQEHYKSLDHLLNLKNHLKNEENGESNAAAANEEEEEGEDVSESSSDEDNEIPQGAAAAAVVAESSEGSVRKVYSNQTGTQYIFHPTESLWEYRVSDMIFGFPRGISSLEHLVTSPSPSSAASSSSVNHWTILSQTISYFHEKSHLICILILRSGKFAASIFDTSTGKSMIHKVFRRYTVRAKAGGSQSSHDSKGRKAQSIGSQLRRYGEQALREDIYKLLLSWKDFINNSSAIFLSLPKTMRSYIFHNDLPQDRDYPLKTTTDSRIKFLSFPVKNPIYEELCAVYEKCMMIHFTQFTSLDDPTAPTPGDANAGGDRKVDHRAIQDSNSKQSSSAPRPPNEAEVGLQQYSVAEELIQLQRACESSDIREVNSLLSELRTSMNEDHVNDPVSIESLATLLHIVAEKGDAKLVTLLLEFGASPEVKDIRSRTPYHLCKDKDTRDAFRRLPSSPPLSLSLSLFHCLLLVLILVE
jgi:ankyrin repeat protein